MEAMASESQTDLASVWRAVAASVPQPWELGGVTYHGPDHPGPWIAFVFDAADGTAGGPEGMGSTAVEALRNLAAKLQQSDPGVW